MRLSMLAGQAERAAREGAPDDARRLGVEMRDEFARFAAAFQRHLPVEEALR